MSQNQPVGVPFQNPTRYVGPHMDVVPIKRFPRRPLTTDKKYRIGQMAILGKEPTTGEEGELWYLCRFDENGNAIWCLIATKDVTMTINIITTDDGSPGVVPEMDGNVNILGGNGIMVTGNGPGSTVLISVDGEVVASTYNADSGSAMPVGGMLNIFGTGGITTSASGNTINISGSGGGGGITWSTITDPTQDLLLGNGYFANAGGGVVFTLPPLCAVGDTFIVSAQNITGWTINQNAGQSIQLGNISTSLGLAGSLSSTAIGDTVTLVCSALDQTFRIINSMGNITVD